MQVADSRAEDSSESGSSQEKALGSSSSSFTSSEGVAVKPVDGKGSDEDASITLIPAKRHVIKKPAKKTVVGIANSISSEANLVNGTTSLKDSSEDCQDKPDLELNTAKENTEDNEEDASGEERLVEASKGSQKAEEVTKIAKPKGRPTKLKVTLQSEEIGEVKLPKVAKPQGKPPKARDYHSGDDSESKVEEQDEMLEAKSGSEEGDTGEAEGLSHDTENSESMEVLPPLASTKRGRAPKAKSAETGKVARPRGRPPKPTDSQSGSEPAKSKPLKRKSDTSTASSKRGRPPKARLMENNTEEGGAVVHARPRGRPPKGAQDGATLKSPKTGRTPKPKAKRGRPSKASLMQSDIPSPGRDRKPKLKKKRGRPSLASLAVASNASPARPRGRPPKQSLPQGRQRKLPLPSSATEGEQPATPRRGQTPKAKGRGRQTKVKTDSGTKEKTKSSRPRGRPRSIKVAESGTEESSEIEDPEVTASSDRESSPTEREDQSGSESGMKEAGKGVSEQKAGQTHTAKMRQPPKRKSMSTTGRGRPPKVKVTDTGTEGETEEPKEPANSVPSKRGRPPKVKPAQSGIEEDGVEPAISVSPGRGRPPKAKQTKKGRPPKAVEVNAEGEACGEDKDQMAASPGAGSLQTDPEDAVASTPSDLEESGEKEGVMIEVTGAEIISDKEDEEEVKAKAAGKGRPPKVKDFKSSGEQKKRGRPAKAKDSEQA